MVWRERGADGVELPHVDAADPQPAHDGPHRNAKSQYRQRGQRSQRGYCIAAQANRRCCPRGAGTDPRVASFSACPGFGDQQRQAEQHQHAGQHAARGPVEGDLELLEDRDCESGEADHRKRTVFGEEMDTDQQSTAEDCQPQLRQYDAEEHAGCVGSQRPCGLLDSRVEPAQRRRDGQVHEREVRQCGDQHPSPQPVQVRNDADPGVAVDERRNGKRRNEQRAPERAAGQVGPLDQPRRPDADDDAQRHRDGHQSDRVEQQVAHPGPDDQLIGAPAARRRSPPTPRIPAG